MTLTGVVVTCFTPVNMWQLALNPPITWTQFGKLRSLLCRLNETTFHAAMSMPQGHDLFEAMNARLHGRWCAANVLHAGVREGLHKDIDCCWDQRAMSISLSNNVIIQTPIVIH